MTSKSRKLKKCVRNVSAFCVGSVTAEVILRNTKSRNMVDSIIIWTGALVIAEAVVLLGTDKATMQLYDMCEEWIQDF